MGAIIVFIVLMATALILSGVLYCLEYDED